MCFVEDEEKKITTCPACPEKKTRNWLWNNAFDHAVSLASNEDKKKRRPHKELLRYHGFQVDPEIDDIVTCILLDELSTLFLES